MKNVILTAAAIATLGAAAFTTNASAGNQLPLSVDRSVDISEVEFDRPVGRTWKFLGMNAYMPYAPRNKAEAARLSHHDIWLLCTHNSHRVKFVRCSNK
jgi:hypothetical protein